MALKVSPMDLSGRSVLVTGASSGIGRETAILLANLNARVILTARSVERLQETLDQMSGTGHVVSPYDLSDAAGISGWFRSVVAETGPLNGLVHAAGKQVTIPVRFMTLAMVEDVIGANLKSSLMLARAFCQKGCSAAGASLVYISSVMAIVSKPALAAYSATKSALIGMTKSLALELAPSKIRVNCVAPAFVETSILNQVRETLTPEQFANLEQSHPLGFGTPLDVANAVAFLIADTGRWITGSTLVVDGGYSAQ